MRYEYFKEMNENIESEKVKYSDGALKAWREWYWMEDKESEYVFDETLWSREYHDFIETLRKAEVETFILVSASTGLMEDIHAFISEGCKFLEPVVVKANSNFGRDKLGLRFQL